MGGRPAAPRIIGDRDGAAPRSLAPPGARRRPRGAGGEGALSRERPGLLLVPPQPAPDAGGLHPRLPAPPAEPEPVDVPVRPLPLLRPPPVELALVVDHRRGLLAPDARRAPPEDPLPGGGPAGRRRPRAGGPLPPGPPGPPRGAPRRRLRRLRPARPARLVPRPGPVPHAPAGRPPPRRRPLPRGADGPLPRREGPPPDGPLGPLLRDADPLHAEGPPEGAG